ncbi:MAG TPA: ZIP family metal transporter [Methylomirabilota bacterium]|nr:ZIP family metal transporter [Methylomirabilota bacterium]
MPPLLWMMSATAVLSALSGGVMALRLVRHVGYVIAVGAGIRIGAAFFDLLPESVELMGGRATMAMAFAAVGFLAFYVIEKVTLLHLGHETATELDHDDAAHRHVGLIGAGAMSVHSLLDGVAMAAAFQASPELGFVVGLVVVIHRFSDGIGIVSLLLANRVARSTAMRWVFLVSLAPVLGVAVTAFFVIPDTVLGALLATFAGFFLYVGAAELLPEAHRNEGSRWVIAATLAGVAAIMLMSIGLEPQL